MTTVLETMRTRGFYLEKAQQEEFLSELIKGDESFEAATAIGPASPLTSI